MRTFAWTSLIRVIIILAARVYMTNFQSDALYNFLNLNNPATNAINSCMTELNSIKSGHNAQFEAINIKLDSLLSGTTTTTPVQPVTPTLSTGTTTTPNFLTGKVIQLNTTN